MIGAVLLGLSATSFHLASVKETHQNHSHWVKLDTQVPPFVTHEIVFATQHANLDKLEATLFEVSKPGSSKYGKHLTRDEVEAITNTKETSSKLLAWIKANMAEYSVVKMSSHGEYIRIAASITSLEKALVAKFAYYKSKETGKIALRCPEIKLPVAVKTMVHAVFHTTDFPPTMTSGPKVQSSKPISFEGRKLSEPTNLMTPSVLNSFYNIGSNTGSSSASQGVFETGGQYYSPENLQMFQSRYGLPTEKVTTDVGGHAASQVCEQSPNSCSEANLDVQYMMAISQVTPMTYYYESNEEDPFVAFVEAISTDSSPPLVNSISYGSVESAISKTTMDSFNTEAMKFGAMGGSIFVSSGDDGAPNFQVQSKSQCAYNPSYPASSPYVTAVGATYAPSWTTPGVGEIVCQANLNNAVITSGGGFSSVYDAPDYQASAVEGYFKTVSKQPASGYAKGGRGYPDVALSGFGYEVVIGEDVYTVCGTSCSSPSVAAMASLINAIRLEAGSSPLGFLNPAIYAAGAGSFNDITSGENQCTANGAVCCSQGYYAAAGWDPTTGFGSVDFVKFKKILLADIDAATVAKAESSLAAKAKGQRA